MNGCATAGDRGDRGDPGGGTAGQQAGHRVAAEAAARRPRKLAAVALANKMARMVWAMMTSGEAYRRQPAAAVRFPDDISSRNAWEWTHVPSIDR